MSIITRSILASAVAATALAGATPAMARGHHRGNDDTAAIAIGAGVIGLALGAIIASSDNDDRDRDRDRYYDRGYSYGPGYSTGWYYRDGWYWDHDGRRHSRDEYHRHFRGNDYRRGYDRDRDDYRRGY